MFIHGVKSMAASAPVFTLTAGILAQLVRYLKHLNVDVDMVLLSVGVDPAIITNPDHRIPVETYNRIEEAAAEASGDPCFGLHMGEFIEAGNWSILGYLMMNCHTLGEAMVKAGRYYKIIGTQIQSIVGIRNKNIVIVYTAGKNAPQISRHCYESAISSTVCMLRNLSKEDISPVEVGFMSPNPPCLHEYHRVFRSPVLFDQKNSYLTLPWSIMRIPVVCPNAELLTYFEEYVHHYLATLDCDMPVTTEVIKRIISVLDNTNLSIRTIARQMTDSIH